MGIMMGSYYILPKKAKLAEVVCCSNSPTKPNILDSDFRIVCISGALRN